MASNALMHYGVKGMKWGVRKDRKLANAKHQPSSVRSSVLAGVTAATGNKRVARGLEKSNDRDALRWEQAKKRERARKAAEKALVATKNKPVKSVKTSEGKRITTNILRTAGGMTIYRITGLPVTERLIFF